MASPLLTSYPPRLTLFLSDPMPEREAGAEVEAGGSFLSHLPHAPHPGPLNLGIGWKVEQGWAEPSWKRGRGVSFWRGRLTFHKGRPKGVVSEGVAKVRLGAWPTAG